VKFIARTAAVGAAFAAMAVPAIANGPTGHVPVTTPGYDGTHNPGISSNPGVSQTDAVALGRDYCGDFKQNFRDNKSQFGQCIAAVAKTLRFEFSPQAACQNLNRKPTGNERRSDFRACVIAAAKAKSQL
jgi:hypothetical protein